MRVAGRVDSARVYVRGIRQSAIRIEGKCKAGFTGRIIRPGQINLTARRSGCRQAAWSTSRQHFELKKKTGH